MKYLIACIVCSLCVATLNGAAKEVRVQSQLDALRQAVGAEAIAIGTVHGVTIKNGTIKEEKLVGGRIMPVGRKRALPFALTNTYVFFVLVTNVVKKDVRIEGDTYSTDLGAFIHDGDEFTFRMLRPVKTSFGETSSSSSESDATVEQPPIASDLRKYMPAKFNCSLVRQRGIDSAH